MMEKLKISDRLAQPQVCHYIERLGRVEYRNTTCDMTYSERSYELMDELFRLLKKLKPVSKNGTKSLWICARRGSIESFATHFGEYEELLADEEIESYEEYEQYWQSMFPDEIEWYRLDAIEDMDTNYRAVVLKHRHVLEQEGQVRKSIFTHDISEFVEWLVDSVRNCLEALEAGTYNEIIEKELPARHRTGTILRKDLWDIYPEGRKEYFENLAQEEIDEFLACAESDKDSVAERLAAVTANDFFRYCAMGYKENNYEGTELTPREQYFKHADGRHEGMADLDPDSAEEFSKWYHSKERYSGHPWEVCRGGNSTHVDLQVGEDDRGYYLHVAGSSTWRSVEAIKFFLSLHRAGLPVVIYQADLLKERLLGIEKVGVVPDGVRPVYCHSWFPGEKVEAFINLSREGAEKMAPLCVWQPLTPIELI